MAAKALQKEQTQTNALHRISDAAQVAGLIGTCPIHLLPTGPVLQNLLLYTGPDVKRL